MNPDSIKTGGPAFPCTDNTNPEDYLGMTLRDHYAGLAMQEHMRALSGAKTDPGQTWSGVVATLAYQMADAMIAARG